VSAALAKFSNTNGSALIRMDSGASWRMARDWSTSARASLTPSFDHASGVLAYGGQRPVPAQKSVLSCGSFCGV
jgi:hypothetical protein